LLHTWPPCAAILQPSNTSCPWGLLSVIPYLLLGLHSLPLPPPRLLTPLCCSIQAWALLPVPTNAPTHQGRCGSSWVAVAGLGGSLIVAVSCCVAIACSHPRDRLQPPSRSPAVAPVDSMLHQTLQTKKPTNAPSKTKKLGGPGSRDGCRRDP